MSSDTAILVGSPDMALFFFFSGKLWYLETGNIVNQGHLESQDKVLCLTTRGQLSTGSCYFSYLELPNGIWGRPQNKKRTSFSSSLMKSRPGIWGRPQIPVLVLRLLSVYVLGPHIPAGIRALSLLTNLLIRSSIFLQSRR